MTTRGYVATPAQGAHVELGLRACFGYCRLGIREAMQGRFAAHVIRAAAGTGLASQPHRHRTAFQPALAQRRRAANTHLARP